MAQSNGYDDFEQRRLRAVERVHEHQAPESTQEGLDANLRRCEDVSCGQPRTTAGRPRAGWIKAGTTGNLHGERWWCSWDCLSRGALVLSLRGES